MSDQPRKKRHGWKWPVWAAILLLVYALSLGPTSFLVNRGYLPRDPMHPVTYALTLFYSPINVGGDLIPPLGDLKEWYVWQWIKRHG